MIDTDKYEGHTPNEWIVEEGANGDTLVSSFHPSEDGLQTDIALVYSNHIDAQLIADAPLLLEEVKRLRKVVCQLESVRLMDVPLSNWPQFYDMIDEIHEQRARDIDMESDDR